MDVSFSVFRNLLCGLLAATFLLASGDVIAQKRKPKAKPKPPKINLPTREDDQVRVEVAEVQDKYKYSMEKSAARIDELVEANLRKHGIQPNPDSEDHHFIRRVYLDITGTIPTGKQAESFIRRQKSSAKRQARIDALLNSPGYASHHYNYWADVLRVVDRAGNNNNYIAPWGEWLRQSLRENKPFDDMVREMLSAEGKIWEDPAAGYYLRDLNMPLDNLNNTTRIFLGTRIGCAQCHDHPFDRWTQKEFYQLGAFVAGVQYRKGNKFGAMTARNKPKGKAGENWLYDMVEYGSREGGRARSLVRLNSSELWENSKRQLKFPHDYAYDDAKPGQVVKPAVLFGRMPTMQKGQTRREAFAEWVTHPDNPRFTKTIVNRMWKRVMGVGLIEPEDDMTDVTKSSNPELLEYLISEMKRVDYDLKEFLRILYNTKTYQRAATYEELEPEVAYHFPGPVLRRMTAEQVWDSLLTLTIEKPDLYQRPSTEEYTQIVNLEGITSAKELLERTKALDQYNKDLGKKKREGQYKGNLLVRASELPSPLPGGHLLRQFGQSDRDVIAGNDTEGTVPQLLTMFNGPVTHMMLERGSVIYNAVVAEGTKQEDHIDIIFLSLLSRKPTAAEKRTAISEMRKSGARGYGDVIWALLNTREFMFIQ